LPDIREDEMGLLPKVAALAAMILCGGVAQAQDPPARPIELSAQDAFTHEHSKVRLPPVLTGLPRIEASENEPDQLHTSIQYASPDRGEQYIVIIYRDVGGSLPVWFDRARRRAERGEIGSATLHWAGEFVPPGRTAASGLLATYGLTGGAYRSSGVALVPAGEWLITLWAASRTRSPAELDARIPAALAEIAWPKLDPAPPAVPVAACTSALALSGDAKPLPNDESSFAVSMMSAMVRVRLLRLLERAEPRWCRDSIELANAGVYRADEHKDGYFLAINDSGRGAYVGPNTVTLTGEKAANKKGPAERYEVQVTQMSNVSTSGLLDRLPPPAQALAIAMGRRFVAKVPTWGEGAGQAVMRKDARR
jgi:hypothetical protein